ncbi:MAG: hypothetical protein ACREOZ_01060 [Gloeomargaritales cyanobacterium]
MKWYHIMTGHIGSFKLFLTISSHFHFPGISSFIEDYCRTCQPCQEHKTIRGYGHLPAKDAETVPWTDVCVDLIGPWPIKIQDRPAVFHALTCIDPATNFTELLRIDNATSQHVSTRFENEWLSRYPRPIKCIHDGGPEFIGTAFQHVLRANGILDSGITARNPQANAICERMHQVVGNSLRALIHNHPPQNFLQASEAVECCLAAAMRALRITVHSTLKISPGAAVFRRDMLLPVETIADWEIIQHNKQALIDANNRRENLRRFRHDYEIGDQVFILQSEKGKLQAKTQGPYAIQRVHANGTVTILRGTFLERINIRRLKAHNRVG